MSINFNTPIESQTVAARNTSARDAQIALARWLEGVAVTGAVSGIKRLNAGLVEEWNGSAWVEKAVAYAKLASPAFTGTPTAPTAAQDTNTTQLATTAYVLGQRGGSAPLVNGTAAAGTSLRYSRMDHVHPIDTSRAPLASPNFTGTVTIAGTGRLLNIGDEAALHDINIAHMLGIYSQTDATRGSVRLGSNGPTLNGASGTLTLDGVYAGNGSGLTALNASNLGSGTVPPTRLNAYSDGVTTAELGWRSIPQNLQAGNYTLVAADRGRHVGATGAGAIITIPSGVFAVNDAATIVNMTTGNITIAQGAGTTLRLAGTANTGNRTLAQRGKATFLCPAANEFYISGPGLS